MRRRPGRLHDDDEDSDIRPRQLAPEAEKEEELEEPDTEPEEMEAEPAAVTITRRRVTARADNDEEDEEWRHDPMLRLLKKRGLPTRMPFGRHKGRSLREMWESEDRECVFEGLCVRLCVLGMRACMWVVVYLTTMGCCSGPSID